MSELQRRRQRDVLLTTLIDLLVQVLFLLLVAIVLVAPTTDMQETAAQAQELMKDTGKSLPEIADAWRRLVDPDTLELKYRKLAEQRDDLQQKEQDLQSRLKSYERRFQALGDKPCWMTADLRPETLLLVRVFDDAVEIFRRWDPAREQSARDFQVPLHLMGRRISLPEFAAAFRPMFEVSKRERCRHYVSLEIAAQSGAKATDNRAVVETYFYPRDVRRISQ
jgi:hypothetical protein